MVVLINEEAQGPLRFNQLTQLVHQKECFEKRLGMNPGLADWIAAGDVPALFAVPFPDEHALSNRNVAGRTSKSKYGSNVIDKASISNKRLRDYVPLSVGRVWFVGHSSIFVLSQHQIEFQPHGLAFINALIFAKVMLVAQDVHLGNRLNDRPLIYSVIFKSILFAIALICFHIVEHVVIGLFDGRALSETISEIGVNKLKGIVSIGIITTVALVPFFVLAEISRVIGKEKIWFLFFQREVDESSLLAAVDEVIDRMLLNCSANPD